MINNRQQTGRRRGRGGQRLGGGNAGGGGGGRSPEMGNRIDSRARGNAAQLLEKYKTLARDAQQAGDRVLAEYYLQFADHYFRVLAESRARFEEANPRRAQAEYPDGGEGYDEDGEGEEGDGDDEFAPPRQQARPREDRPREDRPQQQRDDRPQRPQRDDRPQRNEGRNEGQRDDRPREDRPQREPRPQRDEGMRDERPRQQPREDFVREPAVESEVAQIYRDESAAREERAPRDERPTRDGTRRRLGMHSTSNGARADAPRSDGGGNAVDDSDHGDDHALPLDVLPPSIMASVAPSNVVDDDLPLGVEGEVTAPAPRKRGRPRKVVPEAPIES